MCQPSTNYFPPSRVARITLRNQALFYSLTADTATESELEKLTRLRQIRVVVEVSRARRFHLLQKRPVLSSFR